jgi:hypothetical protein
VHCTRCGTELVPGAQFCATCGAPVGAPILPTWARLAGVLSALLLAGVLVTTVVVPDRADEVAAEVVAGDWDCDLRYASTDDDAPDIVDPWDVTFDEDGTLTVEDRSGEVSEGEWSYEDGDLSVDFGDADFANPELDTSSIDLDSLDDLTVTFERTEADDEDEVGDRTLTCGREG